MVEALRSPCYGLGDESVRAGPSYDRYGYGFSTDRYWRGPVWINVDWMLMRGLERYGFDEQAPATCARLSSTSSKTRVSTSTSTP